MNKNLELLLNISLLNTTIIKKMDRSLSVHGIAFSEFMVMYQISLTPHKTIRRIDLAQEVGMSASGITRLLNPMEKIKLIEKEANPRDARVSFVKLSDAGIELLNNAMKSVAQSSDEMLKEFNTKDINVLFRLAKILK
ncbi:MarR family transcriptional regulator [Sulfurimonas sp. SAG-AH-194-C21]|nr:MarR family transcriptional regulator [Sulfurimonas sp. SAG-AH-194-C21]MDF1884246.1 MarR family transcriptional regulator [Sulfurimonas sp. SAG-AH-194-C21]